LCCDEALDPICIVIPGRAERANPESGGYDIEIPDSLISFAPRNDDRKR